MAKTASDIMEAHDPHLHEAIEDAYYLLAYFSRTRVEIPPDKRSQFDESVTILSSARAIGSRLFQPPIGSAPGGAGEAPAAHTQATAGSDPVDGVHATPAEKDSIAAFWKAFIQLSDLAYPATIESIRYYFRYYNFHFSGRRSQKPGQRDNIKRGVVTFYLNQLSFTFLTIIALSMTIGLSLLSYIGTKSLVAYDDDYTNWSQVQTLSQYLDEAAKVNLKDTIKDTILEITPNTAHSRTIPTQKDGPQEVLSISDPRTKSDPAPDIKFVVPKARAERLNAILAAAAADQRAIAVDFSFACRPIITMFAEAQHVPLPADNQPVNPGGLTVDECKSHVLNAVPPRVIAVADDLASTYSNIKKERETLHRILEIILTPIRLFDVLVVSPSEWAYDALLDILSGRSGPVKSDPGTHLISYRPRPKHLIYSCCNSNATHQSRRYFRSHRQKL
jgi:hypothetical protein